VKILYTAAEIAQAIERLAREIARDHAGQPLVLLGVLKGAIVTTVDLARALAALPDGPSQIFVDFISVGSYGNSTQSSGSVRLRMDSAVSLQGQNVVLVEDIVDTGLTLEYLQALFEERGAAGVRTCVLFDKPARRKAAVPLDYAGLCVPDAFVVGYGLDYQEMYRNLPYLAVLETHQES
jgi:hypoxanthine phosphoribosyltransferase